jgi:hypothetical protein
MTIYFVYELYSETDMTVSKTVEGKFADHTKYFTFTMSLAYENDDPLSAGEEFDFTIIDTNSGAPAEDGTLILTAGGNVDFQLKHGQMITISGIPSFVKAGFKESTPDGYFTSYKYSEDQGSTNGNDTGLILAGSSPKTFDFINREMVIVPTGIDGGDQGFEALVLLVAMVFILGIASIELKRRKIWTR